MKTPQAQFEDRKYSTSIDLPTEEASAEIKRLLSHAAATLGRLGGKAGTGKAKARTTEQARAAALKMWEKRRKKDE